MLENCKNWSRADSLLQMARFGLSTLKVVVTEGFFLVLT